LIDRFGVFFGLGQQILYRCTAGNTRTLRVCQLDSVRYERECVAREGRRGPPWPVMGGHGNFLMNTIFSFGLVIGFIVPLF